MVTIRSVAASDLIPLNELYEQLSGERANNDSMLQLFHTIQNNPQYHLLGAYVDDVLVGSVMGIVCHDLVGSCRPFMVVENVVVSDMHQGMGIGKMLMGDIERIARERECTYIMLVSSDFRQQAHRFYASLGYEPERVRGFRKELKYSSI